MVLEKVVLLLNKLLFCRCTEFRLMSMEIQSVFSVESLDSDVN
jgi:hypothetical protein